MYQSIDGYPSELTEGKIMQRMLDGLGYRYHWASKDLSQNDLDYRPSADGKSCYQTLQHIYELAVDARLLSEGKTFERPRVQVSDRDYSTLRSKTLENIKQAAQNFSEMTAEEIAALEIVFKSREAERRFPVWHFFNGQLADAIYHTGQIVLLRRASGNPVSKEMNVFMGK